MGFPTDEFEKQVQIVLALIVASLIGQQEIGQPLYICSHRELIFNQIILVAKIIHNATGIL